ncbi:LysR family transcriptional regulator [Pseudorhodoferax soli]|uniref:LysR family transcriptional regulator n=1 Tax=Pseudorhodoferax soli TaxID=545864 RepID=A0A368XB93_9BURK|nr:LysR family transcriptional regulator [Pseudorhodoferax soli]RCW65241.1 LysR family transcriptional regulator [Pseudorhodoferax soli]
MRLHGLDLNLLLALDALLQTERVTAAAERLHVTQSTMSGSLARLREHFNDPLLVPAGRVLMLTPLGQVLRTPVRALLQQVEETVSLRPTFEPLRDRRRFVLCASHMTLLVLGAPLVQHLRKAAPGVTLEWMETSPDRIGDHLRRGDIDLAFAGEPFASPAFPSVPVIEDEYVCIAWKGNRRVARGLSRRTYQALGHVGTRYGPQGLPGGEQHAVDRLQIVRRVEVVCASPAMLAAFVVGTDRIATVASKLARRQAEELPLQILPTPWRLSPVRMLMQWSQHREGDGGLDWMRQTVRSVAARCGCLVPPAGAPA